MSKLDTTTPVSMIEVDGIGVLVVNGKYNIEAIEEEDGTQTLNITDWNYSKNNENPDAPANPETFDRVFANNTPAQIATVSSEIAKNNYTSQQVAEIYGWNLGDAIPITLSSGEVIEMQIIGFNHDILSSDHTSEAGLTLHMKNCSEITYPMNSARQNDGGYPASLMKTETLPTLKALLPQEWQNVIKLVDKNSANGGSSSYTETVTLGEDLFLLSEIEVSGASNYAVEGGTEGAQYEYYTLNSESLIKNQGSGGSAVRWWLRSVHTTSTPSFCSISTMGSVTSYRADRAIGVAFAFCV